MTDPLCPFCGSSLLLKKSTRNGKCRACGRGIPPTRCKPDPHWKARTVTIGEQAWGQSELYSAIAPALSSEALRKLRDERR